MTPILMTPSEKRAFYAQAGAVVAIVSRIAEKTDLVNIQTSRIVQFHLCFDGVLERTS
jgi:hypothetical protein